MNSDDPERKRREMVYLTRTIPWSRSDYPTETLSSVYFERKHKVECDAAEAIKPRSLGINRYPSPRSLLDYWFETNYDDVGSFFCTEDHRMNIKKLCGLFTHAPLHCIFIARVSMKEKGYERMEENQHSPEDLVSSDRRSENGLGDVRGSQSFVGIASHPPRLIEYKNRKNISKTLERPSTRHQTQTEKRKRERDLLFKESNGSYRLMKKRKTNDGRSQSHKLDSSKSASEEKKKETEKERDETGGGGGSDENNDTKETNDRHKRMVGESVVKRKLNSTWTLLAYIVMNRYDYSDEEVKKRLKKILQSKGVENRIMTVFDIAKTDRLPVWVAKEMVDGYGYGTEKKKVDV